MRKFLLSLPALLLFLSSCNLHDRLYIDLPDTAWRYEADGVTTWVCFHDGTNASILQYNSATGRYQTDHGTYSVDGHSVDIYPSTASTYSLVRTYSNLKHFTSNKNFTKLQPKSYPSVEGSVWAAVDTNDLHILYLGGESVCADICYRNVTRKEDKTYGWSAARSSYVSSDSMLDAGGVSASLYGDLLYQTCYSMAICSQPVEEEGTSSLKGTLWTYNNTGYPADSPYIVIFNGKDTFTRIYGVSAIGFVVENGSYTISDGTVEFTLGDKTRSCSISGDSFTLWERTYVKLDY